MAEKENENQLPLPTIFNDHSILPNCFIRGPLVSARPNKTIGSIDTRPYLGGRTPLDMVEIGRHGETIYYFMGYILTERESDVLQYIVSEAPKTYDDLVSKRIEINAYGYMKYFKKSNSTKNNNIFNESLRILQKGNLKVKNIIPTKRLKESVGEETIDFEGPIIRDIQTTTLKSESGKVLRRDYSILVHPGITKLFASHTQINTIDRSKTKSNIGKRLLALMESHDPAPSVRDELKPQRFAFSVQQFKKNVFDEEYVISDAEMRKNVKAQEIKFLKRGIIFGFSIGQDEFCFIPEIQRTELLHYFKKSCKEANVKKDVINAFHTKKFCGDTLQRAINPIFVKHLKRSAVLGRAIQLFNLILLKEVKQVKEIFEDIYLKKIAVGLQKLFLSYGGFANHKEIERFDFNDCLDFKKNGTKDTRAPNINELQTILKLDGLMSDSEFKKKLVLVLRYFLDRRLIVGYSIGQECLFTKEITGSKFLTDYQHKLVKRLDGGIQLFSPHSYYYVQDNASKQCGK